jgi:hypothetical protein
MHDYTNILIRHHSNETIDDLETSLGDRNNMIVSDLQIASSAACFLITFESDDCCTKMITTLTNRIYRTPHQHTAETTKVITIRTQQIWPKQTNMIQTNKIY